MEVWERMGGWFEKSGLQASDAVAAAAPATNPTATQMCFGSLLAIHNASLSRRSIMERFALFSFSSVSPLDGEANLLSCQMTHLASDRQGAHPRIFLTVH